MRVPCFLNARMLECIPNTHIVYMMPRRITIIQDMGREHFLKIPAYGAQFQKCIFDLKEHMAVAQSLIRITCPIRMVALLRSRVLKDELLPRWELGSTHTGFSTNYGILGRPPLSWTRHSKLHSIEIRRQTCCHEIPQVCLPNTHFMYTLPCQLAIIQDMGREHFLKIPTYGAQCQKCIFAMKKYMAVAQRLTRITCPIRMVALLRSRVLKDELLPRWELGSTHTGFSTNYGILGRPPLSWTRHSKLHSIEIRRQTCCHEIPQVCLPNTHFMYTLPCQLAIIQDMGREHFLKIPTYGAQCQKCTFAMKKYMAVAQRLTLINMPNPHGSIFPTPGAER